MSTFDTLLFRCAVCQQDVKDYPSRNGRDRQLEPICRMCEHFWTERSGKPSAGAFMDRRKTMHILALSEALRSTAASFEWKTLYG
jgi:hypothetical protein